MFWSVIKKLRSVVGFGAKCIECIQLNGWRRSYYLGSLTPTAMKAVHQFYQLIRVKASSVRRSLANATDLLSKDWQ